MRKSEFKTILNQSIEDKALKDLNKKKKSHSKVMDIIHTKLKMRKYLLPNEVNSDSEMIQLIFKLRCRVTEIKTNFKGIYDSYECDACGNEEESQAHILECTKLTSMNTEVMEMPKYEKLFHGNVQDQVKIASIFKENMKAKEHLKNLQ